MGYAGIRAVWARHYNILAIRRNHSTGTRRSFNSSSRSSTDGVFRELTAARVARPWIEAFRNRQAAETEEEHGNESKPNRSTVGPTPDRMLQPKRMSDSYHKVILPLARDPWLSDTYLNSSGHIRIGTLFMDLDALSGVCAYKHTGDDVTTVTAAFDRITMNKPITEICDLELSGEVTYTGTSSMEISLQVARVPEKGRKVQPEDVFISCSCTMVSLDPVTKHPVKINPLIVETDEEKRLYALGERNSQKRKAEKQTSLIKYTPNDEESDIIHALWQKQLQWHDPNVHIRKPASVHFMDQSILRTAAIMQPQYRNRHQFMIFGGYLLKSTFELAFCCAASFSHSKPVFVSLDPSTFRNPVPVGSVLYLTATVTYTEPGVLDTKDTSGQSPKGGPLQESAGRSRIQVRVDSKVRNIEHGETKPTGQFNYTFMVDKDIQVMPRTYTEFMMYIDARRRAKRVAELMEGMEAIALQSMTE